MSNSNNIQRVHGSTAENFARGEDGSGERDNRIIDAQGNPVDTGVTEQGCKFDVSHLLTEVRQSNEKLEELMGLLQSTAEKLIDTVAGKGMVPLDVFKWLVAFMILIEVSREIGKDGLKELVQTFRSDVHAVVIGETDATAKPETPIVVGR